MSDATLSDPHVRAAQNRWYLYFDGGPAHGPDGLVRAVIEEVGDEILNGDDGPKRTLRRVFLNAMDVRDNRQPSMIGESASYDGLDNRIETWTSDEEFQRLIAEGTVVPIPTPSAANGR